MNLSTLHAALHRGHTKHQTASASYSHAACAHSHSVLAADPRFSCSCSCSCVRQDPRRQEQASQPHRQAACAARSPQAHPREGQPGQQPDQPAGARQEAHSARSSHGGQADCQEGTPALRAAACDLLPCNLLSDGLWLLHCMLDRQDVPFLRLA